MTKRPKSETALPRLSQERARPSSYARLAVTDGIVALGVIAAFSGLAGAFDDSGDALFLGGFGVVATTFGVAAHRRLDRRLRPAPGRVLSGLALSWLILVVIGMGIYLATGTTDRVDNALVESAAGFSTTSVTTLDPSTLTVPMQLFRAGTQWLGGLIGIIVGVVALPLVFRGSMLTGAAIGSGERLNPNATIAQQRVSKIYLVFTLLMFGGYVASGLGALDSIVHAFTTVSTGGFSSHADSFVGFGSGARTVAVVGMTVAGSSYFVIWWALRGRIAPLWRSTELRVYVGLLAAGSVLVALSADGVGLGEAAFMATSALSTTGYAIGDWTLLDNSVLMLLLILIGTGSMSGSAGGGLRVARAWTLVGFARRELRRQLDPHSVAVIKQGGAAIGEPVLERTTGYQIAHLGLSGLAAFLLAAADVDVVGAIYTGISVLSTHGPGVGTDAFGNLEPLSPLARLFLTPFMLAGRLTILPLLLAVSFAFRVEKGAIRRARRIITRAIRR